MKKTLHKQPTCRTLEQELTISVKELLFIIFIVAIFFIFAFMTIPQTFGYL